MKFMNLIAAAVVCACSMASAQPSTNIDTYTSLSDLKSGNDFLRVADLWTRMRQGSGSLNTDESYAVVLMLGVVQGMRLANDGITIRRQSENLEPIQQAACIPEGVSSGQLVMVIKADLEKLPTILHLPFTMLAQGILSARYPCKGK